MELKKYTTTVSKIEALNDHVKLFRLNFPAVLPFKFEAGQFIILNVADAEGKPQRRSYSIASSPKNTDYVELCVKILPDGRVSGFLDTVREGHHIEVDGPYGKFTVDKEAKKEIILVAAGVGIAPIRSLLLDLHESGYDAPVSLFFGFRFMTDYLFKEEFARLKKEYPLFSYYPVISRPKDGEEGEDIGMDVGHVNGILFKYIKNADNKIVYICGSLPMVKDVVAELQGIGITRDQIRTDAWG
jgi:NAD(P)H-flavin reductase